MGLIYPSKRQDFSILSMFDLTLFIFKVPNYMFARTLTEREV